MLKIKNLKIKSFAENVVYISSSCQNYDVSKLRIITKVELHGGKKPVFAFLQVIDDTQTLSPTQIGLNQECFDDLGLKEDDLISISVADTPESFSSIKRKIYGNALSLEEYKAIIEDIKNKRYSNMDITAFLVALGASMTQEEVLYFTQSIIAEKKIKWGNEKIITDYYCIGGLPASKIDFIILAIVAAYGILMPKTCSYSLTSCSGMGNVANVFANIELDDKRFKNVATQNKGAIAYYGSLTVGDFNSKIFPVERYIGLTKIEQLAASIIAIKISSGITHIVIDLPVGPHCVIRSSQEASKLRKTLEYLGDCLELVVEVIITDGREPIGNGIGPFLEARDIMKVLKNQEDAPQDLREKAIFAAGKILDFDPKLRGGQGAVIATEILNSGRAFDAFNKIIHAQGCETIPHMSTYVYEHNSAKTGSISSINNSALNYMGILAGANRSKGSGIDLYKKLGDPIKAGEPIFKVYAKTQADLLRVKKFAQQDSIYDIN